MKKGTAHSTVPFPYPRAGAAGTVFIWSGMAIFASQSLHNGDFRKVIPKGFGRPLYQGKVGWADRRKEFEG